MSRTKAASTHAERLQKQKRRSQRYHPLMEPMMLPEGYVETVHRILGSYVHQLRSALSWLDKNLELPLVSLGVDVRLDREYGKKGAPDVDDARVTITFHDGKNGPNCQRYTWAFADGPDTRDHAEERMKDEGGRMKTEEGRKSEGGGREEDETEGKPGVVESEAELEEPVGGLGGGGSDEGGGLKEDETEQRSDEGGEPEATVEGCGMGPVDAEGGNAMEAGERETNPGIEEVRPIEDAGRPDQAAVAAERSFEMEPTGEAFTSGGWWIWIWGAGLLIVLFGLAVFARSARGGVHGSGVPVRTARAADRFAEGSDLRGGRKVDEVYCGNWGRRSTQINA